MTSYKTIRDRNDYVTDYVANGSFKNLKNNVTYNREEGYAILLRLVDHSNGFRGNFVYVDKKSYDFLSKSSLNPGDLIISNVGENVGTVFQVPNLRVPMTLGPNSILVRMSDGTPDFWYYWFSSYEGQMKLKSIVSSSAQPKFNKTTFKQIVVPEMHIDTRNAIGKTLKIFDDKIAYNCKINAELEQTLQLIYDFWFTQFDFPDAKGKPYKSSGGEMSYNDQLKCKIPAGWEVQNLWNNIITEIIKPKIDYFADTKKYLATAGVSNLNVGSGSTITFDNRESRANMQPIASSVWFAKMENSVKHIIVGDYSNDLISEAIFSTGFMGLKVSKTAFEYVACFIRNPHFEKVKDLNSHGATMSGIGNEDMKNIKFIIPDEETLASFSNKVKPIYHKIDLNRRESAQLAQLRDWLLPMLMNGQVKVL